MVANIRKNDSQGEVSKLNVKGAQANAKKAPLAAVSAQIAYKKSRRPQQSDISDTTRKEATKNGLGSQASDNRSSIYKTWKGDPLSLFMFSAAPIIMMLNFDLRTTLSDAQTIETKNQVDSAFISAQQKEEQGDAQAEQAKLDASGILAGAVGSSLQTVQGGFDEIAGGDVFSNEAANQGHMLDDLRSAKVLPEDQVQGGNINATEDFQAGKTLAEKFENSYQEKFDAALKKRQSKDFQNGFKKARVVGMGKDDSLVELENRNLAAKTASEAAFKELSSENVNLLKTNEDFAEGFVGELGDANAVSDKLRGFNKSDRSQMLKEFAKSNQGATLKKGLTEVRNLVSGRAEAEGRYFQSMFNKRQMFQQAISGVATGATKLDTQNTIIQAAENDAESRREDAIASVMASAKGAQDSVIASALEQVRGLFDWYAQMESQVTSAITQHMA